MSNVVVRWKVYCTVQVQARQTAGQEYSQSRTGALSRAEGRPGPGQAQGLANEHTVGDQAPAAPGLPAGWGRPTRLHIFLRTPSHLTEFSMLEVLTPVVQPQAQLKGDNKIYSPFFGFFHVRPLLRCAGGQLRYRATESLLITSSGQIP